MSSRNLTMNSHRWRRGLAAVALCLGFFVGKPVAGQPQEDPVKRPRMDTNAPAQPPPGVGVIQQQGRPFYLQGAVVALLTGGAVWTVCRSSRRV
jgi:hypothetical protein